MTVDLELGDTQQLIRAGAKNRLARNEMAYVLATALWETAYTMEPVKEAYWLSEDWRRDNLSYYPWYGRGYVQLTWQENYQRADTVLELGGALMADPDLALDPEIAAQVIVKGMYQGWFTGLRLDDYLTADETDYIGARAIVNGTDRAGEIAELAEDYEAALAGIGYGDGLPIGRILRPAELIARLSISARLQHEQILALRGRMARLESLFAHALVEADWPAHEFTLRELTAIEFDDELAERWEKALQLRDSRQMAGTDRGPAHFLSNPDLYGVDSEN